MKVMAIGTLKPLTPEQRQMYLPKEVPATLQLYVDGKMEQFWLRDNNAGVIFLMTVDSVEEADTLLKALPLGQANLLTFDLMPIGPLTPLGMLIKPGIVGAFISADRSTQSDQNVGGVVYREVIPACIVVSHRVPLPAENFLERGKVQKPCMTNHSGGLQIRHQKSPSMAGPDLYPLGRVRQGVESGGRAPQANYCASVSPSLRPVSAIVRRRPASVSDNVRQKPAFIARRAVHHCAPLQIIHPTP
jgi:hypothetical protein